MHTIDTLSIAKELLKAGFTQAQAEVQVQILQKLIDEEHRFREKEIEAKQLATKGDLQKAEIRLIYWIVGNFIALAALILFK